MGEYYRQFAFVSSVLAGFAFTFYATLLAINRPHRAVSWAALLTVTASICFLTVTLGTTFAATQVVGIRGSRQPSVDASAAQSFVARQRTRRFRLIASR